MKGVLDVTVFEFAGDPGGVVAGVLVRIFDFPVHGDDDAPGTLSGWQGSGGLARAVFHCPRSARAHS